MTTTRHSDIVRFDSGARFYKADLHVHSYGASADVGDPGMTVEAIVDAAVAEGVSVISITDHNTDKNSERSVEYGARYADRLLVVPGIEVTTANGHLLVYFPPEHPEKVGLLLGKIDLQGVPGARDSHTAASMSDVIRAAEGLGGLCVAAHIDRAKMGFEMMISGYPNAKKDILRSSGLYGLEFDDIDHFPWYSLADDATQDGSNRKQLIEARRLSTATAARIQLAAIQSTDSHSLAEFRAKHASRSFARMKMTALGFDGFRTALTDPEARVRADVTVPPAVPRLIGIQINGGFLDGTAIHFSQNLNSFIGGRGTGKSTAIRCIVYALGVSDELEAHDNCPDNVVLYAEDANGVMFRYVRIRGQRPTVQALEDRQKDPIAAPADSFRVEYYGQGDLENVSRDPLENASTLQEFLDRHIVLADLESRRDGLLAELEQNSAQLIPLETAAAQLAPKENETKGINQKLQIAEEGHLKDVAAFQSKLAAEKNLAESLLAVADTYDHGITLGKFKRDFDELAKLVGPLTGSEESDVHLETVRAAIAAANVSLQGAEREISARLKERASELRGALRLLAAQHATFDNAVAAQIVDLQRKGLSGSIKELTDLLERRTVLNREIGRIKDGNPELLQLRMQRVDLLTRLQAVEDEAHERRKAQLTVINKNLRRTIDDYSVNIYYATDGIIDGFRDLVAGVMRGSYLKDQDIAQMCRKADPRRVAALVSAGDVSEVATECGVHADWARELTRRFGILTDLHRLQVVRKAPRPVIKVLTKGGQSKQIPVNQLSDGQKHTILLTIAMLAESNLPLIMDQPEDDLDNAFIFKSVVTTLRSIKERRQVILVTHNANIAVLGDSELILPLERASHAGAVFDRGAIDHPKTKDAVQQILEGGPLAFQRRQAMYGI